MAVQDDYGSRVDQKFWNDGPLVSELVSDTGRDTLDLDLGYSVGQFVGDENDLEKADHLFHDEEVVGAYRLELVLEEIFPLLLGLLGGHEGWFDTEFDHFLEADDQDIWGVLLAEIERDVEPFVELVWGLTSNVPWEEKNVDILIFGEAIWQLFQFIFFLLCKN